MNNTLEVTPHPGWRMNELSLFTGTGGGVLGTTLLGFNHVGYVEFNEYCQRVLKQRIADGFINEAPIFGDIRSFIDQGFARAYQGMVDVISAGFPCQPWSVSGEQKGGDDERNMWPSTIEAIRQVGPRFVLLENVPGIVRFDYFGTILGDLADAGYNAEWGIVSASSIGGCHVRDRLWILAYTDSDRLQRRQKSGGCKKSGERRKEQFERLHAAGLGVKKANPRTFGSDDVSPNRVDRLKAIGNGQVPQCAAVAFNILSEGLI